MVDCGKEANVLTDHETQIMHRLQDTILEHCQGLVDVTQYMAELDWYVTLLGYHESPSWVSTCPHLGQA